MEAKNSSGNLLKKNEGAIAAKCGSRGLAYLSTAHHADGLNCWVRNESRCFPVAMAAIAPKPRSGFEPECS